MYCVTIYNKNLRKLNGDESLRITQIGYFYYGIKPRLVLAVHISVVNN